jgi:pSer/pThr/pTyr-binding forkhead associated (FHA) protein
MPARDPSGETETRRHVTSAEATPTSLEVVVVEGPDAGKRVALDTAGGKILVGTSALCELRLTEPTVSRRHASIERTDLGTLATDLGSTNGTYLGDARIVAAYLGEGSRLRVGSAHLEERGARRRSAGWRRAARA